MLRTQYKIGISLATLWIAFNLLFWPIWRSYHYLSEEALSTTRILEKFGTPLEFKSEKFRNGSDEVRSAMIGDFVTKKYYLGQPRSKPLKELGNGERRFSDEVYLNFKIRSPKNSWNDNAEYWLFLEDKKGIITEIRVEEHCCSNPYATYLHGKGWMKLK